ncbi:hypothetical protein F5148DRAFT_821621 [Russula earlei]|uniref:Uncharacterized protein n=1 Tax=Russula earlei TaxID=71964 RepID=A0ACC0TU76_9AGAM|nr:hypothetical protein F5148DRAFT_821621 [Russula earlei]
MPKLLLSANHLYRLELRNIPDSGYFSPRDLVACLSEMSRLDSVGVEFRSPPRYPASRHTPPLTPSVLPSLTKLMFQGVHEYLEDLLAQIEAPLLSLLKITFFMDPHFVVPYLRQSINYAELFKKCHRAIVCTSYHAVRFAAFQRNTSNSGALLRNHVWRRLDIVAPGPSILQTHWNMNATHWVELFDPFTAVKDLRLSNRVARDVCRGLEELAEERATEVLPALQNILLRGIQPLEPVPKFIERFVAARQRSGHPVAVYPWRDQENNECFLAPMESLEACYTSKSQARSIDLGNERLNDSWCDATILTGGIATTDTTAQLKGKERAAKRAQTQGSDATSSTRLPAAPAATIIDRTSGSYRLGKLDSVFLHPDLKAMMMRCHVVPMP